MHWQQELPKHSGANLETENTPLITSWNTRSVLLRLGGWLYVNSLLSLCMRMLYKVLTVN